MNFSMIRPLDPMRLVQMWNKKRKEEKQNTSQTRARQTEGQWASVACEGVVGLSIEGRICYGDERTAERAMCFQRIQRVVKAWAKSLRQGGEAHTG